MPETRYSICCHLLPPPPLPITPAAEELNRVQITKLPGAIQLSVVKTEVGGSNSARYRRRWPWRIHLPHSWVSNRQERIVPIYKMVAWRGQG